MALAPIDLALWFSDLGIVYVPEHNNQLEFFNGIQWDDATTTYDQYEFFNKLGGRYQFFLQYGNETNFYAAVDDNRIYNYYTFYKWAHESFVLPGPSCTTGVVQIYDYDFSYGSIVVVDNFLNNGGNLQLDTSTAHNLQAGDTVEIFQSSINGTYTVLSVQSTVLVTLDTAYTGPGLLGAEYIRKVNSGVLPQYEYTLCGAGDMQSVLVDNSTLSISNFSGVAWYSSLPGNNKAVMHKVYLNDNPNYTNLTVNINGPAGLYNSDMSVDDTNLFIDDVIGQSPINVSAYKGGYVWILVGVSGSNTYNVEISLS